MTATLEIAEARPEDTEALGRILSDWIDETPWMPRLHSAAEDRAHIADLIRSGGVLVMRGGGKVLGYVFEKNGHVGALYLAPEARGKGAGKRLLDAVKAGSDRLVLWTFAANTAARRFYAREGFREVEQTPGDNAEHLPDIRMVWTREKQNG